MDPDLYQDWQRELMETGPYTPLFQPPFTLVSSKDVENLPTRTGDLAAVKRAAQ